MTAPEQPRAASLSIDSGWLVDDLGRHTCAGGTPEAGYAHEPGCGLEPLMTVDDLVALFDVLTELGLPINRPDELRQHVAAAERRGAERALAPLNALFAGDPDTPCRTTYRREPGALDVRTECVEVPLDELRAAFDEAERAVEGRA
jgi:hypothetical protein